MSTCLFLSFRFRDDLSTGEMAKLDGLLRSTPRLLKALVHTAASTSDPYVKDGPSPSLVLQLYFAELPELEAALREDGHLGVLLSRDEFPVLAKADVGQQAMLVRRFAVPDPTFKTAHDEPYCTYLVSYEGE